MQLLTATSTTGGDFTANDETTNMYTLMEVDVLVHVLITKPAGRTLG
jgi:hypothetical protein